MRTIGDVVNSIKATFEFVVALIKTFLQLAGIDIGSDEEAQEEE